MMGSSGFLWIPLLLSCVFPASCQYNVEGNSQLQRIISNLPIMIPDGIDPRNINITSVTIKTCTDIKQELTLLNRQLQQKTIRNNQLDSEAFGLRGEVRLLKMKLATCSSTASAITGSYHSQLHNKMKQLLETDDSDEFLIMKTIALTREVNALQIKVQRAANSTDTTPESRELQLKLREKTNDLNGKIQQIERSHSNASLILQIISLQTQIWDLEQAKSRSGETSVQSDKELQALQVKLDKLIRQLPSTGAAKVLQLMSVHSKVALMQRLIGNHIEESRTQTADYQRQWRQRADLLKKKISQLNQDESNTDLTTEILKLQAEVEQFRQLMMNAKKITDSRLIELRGLLEEENKEQDNIQKQLERANYAQAQLIMKIISIMKEVSELQVDEEHQTTSTSQANTLQALLQAKEREYAGAQAKINELQSKLRLQSEECSGLEGRYEDVKTELEQKIVQLNRTGDSNAALILNVINQHNELKTLMDLISTTDDPDRVSELQTQIDEKQNELKSRTADIQRLIANPKTILTIIELQNEIRDLQRKPSNETVSGRVKELQSRVDDLIAKIDDKEDDNTKLMLKIIILQSQVEQLQRQLSNLQALETTQMTRLRNDLTKTENELQKSVNELMEKNQTNARLILEVTDLHDQLRNIENERHSADAASALTVTQLRAQLKAKTKAHSQDRERMMVLQTLLQDKEREHAVIQARVNELQKLKSQDCSELEGRYEHVKTELEQKIEQLNRTGDSKAALILNVMNLHDELKALKDRISAAKDTEKVSELQKQLEAKQKDLDSKTADIERLIANPKIILTIIELQDEIWDLEKESDNGTNSDRVKELQNRVDGLITEIDHNNNAKLMLQMITLQSQVQQLRRRLSNPQLFHTNQTTKLTNDLATKLKELEKCTSELNESNQANAKLIVTITRLRSQLRNLEMEKLNLDQTISSTITSLREQLQVKVEEHFRDQAEIKDLRNQLNQTEEQCSNEEQKLTEVQNELDAKMKELQSKSDSITSLALQISTLTVQVEELKKQQQNTDSETKIKELQKIIDEKTKELDKKTEELKARSAQPQRFLQIIAIQTEIEKYVNVATNDSDHDRIKALQDQLNYLTDGIQDENNENTKLMFKILTQRDEFARLKKQKETQTQENLQHIKDLESELENVRNQIQEKTLMLDSSDRRIANLSAQIMALHWKIRPLEDDIAYSKEANTENLNELQNRLDLTKKQLQDSELRLKEADEKNYNSVVEISALRTKLKQAQRQASRAAKQNTNELDQQIQTQQKENRKLENLNKDLKQEVRELQMCCSDANTLCDDFKSQLQQSQEDATRLQQQLNKKDARLDQLQRELEEKSEENIRLKDDYTKLQNEKSKLSDDIQDLQRKLTDVENRTIHTRRGHLQSRITFDPNTAHAGIALSTDQTEVSIYTGMQNVQDNPHRFDVHLAVLGKTGFSSGRHYWEMSVAGKLCYHLGMASESAPRRGRVLFTPTNGFWTILLNKQGEYKAIDRRVVVIPVAIPPMTLGVLLDYKKGQISFYDAGSRSHLYTFVGQRFTDKIYPFVNFCVEETENQTPVVLLPPGSTDWIK